ncbi:hypothetical protein EV385_3158 [Krasilnikovia cinnamomea]|uniref:Uncharacterized protein n=1 Tax=Krasilnikovia cinnamomea TaxID=349313 RepID=A0A4Q7ZLS9_9ACTN|nr:class II lanthipeptide, LchA2/BrtA2 family [Krasilnikovia cinnamomea]RZU51343.1 hypothetical protein EV385_3158 [Krasilnikovia cinnamomea]
MKNDQNDILARHDEAELIELSEADTYGGSTWACATVTLATAVVCPSTACSRSC